MWENWGSKVNLTKWIEELLRNDEGKTDFLKDMYNYNPDGGNHNIRRIGDFIDPEILYDYLNNANTSPSDEYERKVFESFLSSYKRFTKD